MISLILTSWILKSDGRTNPSNSVTALLSLSTSFIITFANSCSSLPCGECPSKYFAKPLIEESGFLISCATPAAKLPMAASFSLRRISSCNCRTSLMSRKMNILPRKLPL
uniref:DffB n=1 Tax=Yersinia pestis TaxID=632 RepID=Q93AB7_YERPE|nr:DffB [Yersinia pestis]